MDKGLHANVQVCRSPWAAPGCVGLHTSRNDPQEDAPHLVEHCDVALHHIGISTKASIAQLGELESVFFKRSTYGRQSTRTSCRAG